MLMCIYPNWWGMEGPGCPTCVPCSKTRVMRVQNHDDGQRCLKIDSKLTDFNVLNDLLKIFLNLLKITTYVKKAQYFLIISISLF